MKRTNIGGMNAYDQLRRDARQKRDKAIKAARDRYVETIDQIDLLQALNGQRFDDGAYVERQIRPCRVDTPFSELTLVAAAERVLRDNKPLSIAELVVELKRRGCRVGDNPRRMAISLRSAFRYHKGRFKVKSGRWIVL
jgi:hypothetical protein